MLIRVIEAFKIVDLPNIMTSGGPGIATESITLHSYFLWRSNDMGSSAAVAYLLLLALAHCYCCCCRLNAVFGFQNAREIINLFYGEVN